MKLTPLVVIAAALSPACSFVFDGDDEHGQTCDQLDDATLYRDPTTLLCDGSPGCESRCGPCPLDDQAAFVPTWGECGSRCEDLAEQQCALDASCRIAYEARCTISGSCLTNYIGCFPLDQQPDSTIECYRADAASCSRSNACIALHIAEPCPTDAPCEQPFAMCAIEGRLPGRCSGNVICRAAPPDCEPGSTPGILGGCYTGACIPEDICEPIDLAP
ncbi:MAG: hypothetical protein AB7P03_22955 [Kofleriaceae bacterium]